MNSIQYGEIVYILKNNMKNLISCNLMGGLGNQLFEAAHALSQGWKHNREVVFIPRSWTPGQGNGTENYLSNVFRKLNFVENLDGFNRVTEGPFEYSEVREMFEPPKELVDEFYAKYPQLNNSETLSLHVRRSEYLQYPEIHPTITKEYIEEALKVIGNYSTVFVFSDDHQWVKDNLNFPSVIFVNEDTDWKELYLMGLCKNHIISNSTFSWWGVFLNKNKDKKIVCPSRWFGPRGPKADDIYESYWNLIEVEWVEGGKLQPIKK